MSSSVYCYCDDLHLLWSSGLLISTHTYRATQWKTSILVVFEAWSSALPSPTLSIPHRIALFRNILLCSSLLSDLRIKRVWVVTAQQTHWRLWIWITRHHHQMKGTEREREGSIDWLICLRIFLSLYLPPSHLVAVTCYSNPEKSFNPHRYIKKWKLIERCRVVDSYTNREEKNEEKKKKELRRKYSLAPGMARGNRQVSWQRLADWLLRKEGWNMLIWYLLHVIHILFYVFSQDTQ